MTPRKYLAAADRVMDQARAGFSPAFVPGCIIGGLTFQTNQNALNLPSWQKYAARLWKPMGSYGLPSPGQTYRYVILIDPDRTAHDRYRGEPAPQAFSTFTAATAKLELAKPEWKLRPGIPEEVLGRAELHFFGSEQVGLEKLAQHFTAFLESIEIAPDGFRIRDGGYASLRVTPALYEKVAAFNLLRSIRPAAKLRLMEANA
jgi:hypothetical protein